MTDTIVLTDGTEEEYYKVYIEEGFAICVEERERDDPLGEDPSLLLKILYYTVVIWFYAFTPAHYYKRAVTYPEHRIDSIK